MYHHVQNTVLKLQNNACNDTTGYTRTNRLVL